MTRYFDLVPGYESLAAVYDNAIEQASEGKGKERHAEAGEPYEKQIICEVARRAGLGYPLGQAVKKIYESQRIGGERGVAELLGALNYVAAAVIVMREGLEPAPKDKTSDEPRFKPGDRVQADWHGNGSWIDGEVLEVVPMNGTIYCQIAMENGHADCIPINRMRPAPAPVHAPEDADFSEARMRESMPGIVPQDGPSDFDAPQTPEELMQRIVDCNPATYKREG